MATSTTCMCACAVYLCNTTIFFILHTPGVPLSKDNIFVSCNESLIEFLWVIIAFFMFLDQLLWSHFDTNVSKKQNEVGMA